MSSATPHGASPTNVSPEARANRALDSEEARAARALLVEELVALGDVKTRRVRDAIESVRRHLFVPGKPIDFAYANCPLPIGEGQTISQPSVIAVMTEALDLTGTERVLEIGTGSGYQAAILSLLAADVYSIEVVPELGRRAAERLARLGYANVHVRVGDGYQGWPEHAPFDRIIVTAAAPTLPRTLESELAENGILVAPIGENDGYQDLIRYFKRDGRLVMENLGPVRFVPMVEG